MQKHVAYLLQQLESALTVPFCSPIQQHVSEHPCHGAQGDIVARCLGRCVTPLSVLGTPVKVDPFGLFRTLLISLPRSMLMGRWTASRGRGGAPAAQRGLTTSRPTRMRRILGRRGVRAKDVAVQVM